MKNVKFIAFVVIAVVIGLASITTCGRSGPDAPPDVTPPAVASVDPADQSSDVPIDKTITVTFTEPVDASTISFWLVDPTNSSLNVPVTMAYSGASAVFTPNALLQKNTSYNAVLNPGVKDPAGNVMITQRSWYFRTSSNVSTGPSHTITATAGPNGAIDPNGAVSVDDGATQKFTITPNQGYQVADVRVDTVSAGVVTSYTFTNVKTDHAIAASFGAISSPTHTITASAGAGGSITPSGTVTVNDGANQQFTITPNSGNHVTDVKVDGTSVGAVTTYTFSAVKSDHTIAASFAADTVATHTITASAGTGGSITPSGPVTVNDGANQAFTITPSSGNHITDVKVDGTSVGAVTTYTFSAVKSDHSIAASFTADAPVTHTITASAGTGGSISPSGPVTVNDGANQTFTITPSNGYHISDVKADGASVGAVATYTFSSVKTDHTIAASFAADAIAPHTITASAGLGGSISPSGPVTVNDGTNQTFTITPSNGYHIADVKVDGTSVGAVATYTFSSVKADHTIAASFATNLVTFTITASAGTGGTIDPSGKITVNKGDVKSFTVTADSGYEIGGVTGCGGKLSGSTYTTAPITANCTVSASFKKTHTIKSSAGANGTIAPSGDVIVEDNSSQTFTIAVASSGYSISDVQVDNASVGPVPTYTFQKVTSDHVIMASFAAVPPPPATYIITASTGTGGTIAPTGQISVISGGSAQFTITASTGYHVADVQVDGSSQGVITTYAFSNITANHSIAATFAQDVQVTHNITSMTGAGGQIAPLGTVTVPDGGGQTYVITPDTGYSVQSVVVDLVSVGTGTVYQFTNVTGDHTISAQFGATPTTAKVITQ